MFTNMIHLRGKNVYEYVTLKFLETGWSLRIQENVYEVAKVERMFMNMLHH
jgi:hypothetical protein